MRLALIGGLAATVLLVGLVLAPAGSAGGRESARGGGEPCVSTSIFIEKCKVEPKRLVALGARGIMRSIKWKSWGGNKAVGYGEFQYYAPAGDPDSGIGPVKARAKLFQIRSCGGRERYQKLVVNYGPGYRKNWQRGPYFPCSSLE